MSLFPPPQRIRCFSGFALRSEARRCFPLNQVRFLRTTASPPVAPHDASRRRSFHWLQGLWLSLTRTFTVLCKRLYERTNAELQLGIVLFPLGEVAAVPLAFHVFTLKAPQFLILSLIFFIITLRNACKLATLECR
jgi:hypothetical protein